MSNAFDMSTKTANGPLMPISSRAANYVELFVSSESVLTIVE